MDIKMPRKCLLFVFLSVIAAGSSNKLSPIQQMNGSESETAEPPPKIFPAAPKSDGGSEVYDLLNVTVKPPPDPESETVDHPKTVDPGTTHQEGGMPPQNDTVTNKTNESLKLDINSTQEVNSTLSVTNTNSTKKEKDNTKSNLTTEKKDDTNTTPPKRGEIYTCNFPKSWLKQQTDNDSSESLSDDSDAGTNTCSFPPNEWFKESGNDTFHVCTIHKGWLRANNYTIQNSTISTELLADMNPANFSCVTPTDAVKEDFNDTTHYSNIPQAWLRDGNDIYVYLIPEENATETEPSTVSKLDNNSTEESTVMNESISTTISNPELSRVPLTADVTNVKLLSNDSVVETSKVKMDNNSSVPDTVVESTTVKNVSANGTIIADISPKINTPTQEEINKNQTDTEKSKTNEDVDKNKTIQDKDKSVETSSPDVAENVIDGESTTPSSPAALLQKHADHDHRSSSGKTAFLQPTESAAILAGVFVAIALLGYVGLLVWRRILERRYGNREMLVNEDDDFDTSDMRHFEMQNTRSSSVIQFK